MALKNVAQKTTRVPPNPFAGKGTHPSKVELEQVLGSVYGLWHELVSDLKREVKVDCVEWHSSSIKLGWSLRLQVKKRNIVYLGPREGWFLAAFAFGDKALAAVEKSSLPVSVLRLTARCKRYPEGTAILIEVRRNTDLEIVKTLARIKVAN